MAHKLFLFNFLVLPLVLISCNSIEPPPDETVTLKLEDVSCIEAWIKITTNNTQLPAEVTLKKNNTIEKTISLLKQDSVIYIDSLLPKTTYNFQAFIHTNTQTYESNELSVTTMDTTSHNFTWQTFTFGEHSSSVLYDVAIIDENNIWAVGEIFMNGSLGNPDPNAYGFAKWDGNGWKLFRLEATASNGNISNVRPKGILVFNENDIWFAGGSVWHWNGQNLVFSLERLNLFNGGPESIDKLWGTSEDNIYGVGTYGTIVHYTNGKWTKIESGTDVNLKDIYGTLDGKTIWISGYEDFKPTILLKISNSIIEIVFNTRDYISGFNPDHISGEITSIWTNNNNFVYITTPYSLYRKSIYIDPSREEALRFGDPLSWLGRRSRGTDINNIFIAGNRGNVHHYNGVTFKTYQELADNGVTYYSLDVKANLSVLCGQKFENGISDKAIVTIGSR